MVNSLFEHSHALWANWLSQRYRWIPIVTALLFLYALDAIAGKVLTQFTNTIPIASQDLLSKIISLSIFIFILPSWLRIRWKEKTPWRKLGLSNSPRLKALTYFLVGACIAAAFLLKICLVGLGGNWAHWIGDVEIFKLANSLALCLCIGLTEEIIFRGWLWGELSLLVGPQRALPTQAIIFSLFYTRYDIPIFWILGSLAGLFLFGMALAIRRRQNQNSLWGCIGLHGGSAGGWHALQSGILEWTPTTPLWLIGPQNNPIAGLAGISAFCVLIFFQLIALSRTTR